MSIVSPNTPNNVVSRQPPVLPVNPENSSEICPTGNPKPESNRTADSNSTEGPAEKNDSDHTQPSESSAPKPPPEHLPVTEKAPPEPLPVTEKPPPEPMPVTEKPPPEPMPVTEIVSREPDIFALPEIGPHYDRVWDLEDAELDRITSSTFISRHRRRSDSSPAMGEPADPSEGRPVVDLDALRAKARATEEAIGVRECEPSELQRLSFHMNLSASEKEEKSSFALPSGPTTVAAPQEQRATTSEPPRLRVNGKLADVPYLTMRSLRKDFAHELGYVEEKGDDFIFPPQKYLSHHMQFVPCASPDSAYVVNVVDVVDENESKNPLLVRSSDELECADDDLCVELWLLRQELARQIGENELIRGSLRNNIDLGQLLQKQASMAEMNSVWAEYRKAHVRCRICKKVGCDHMTAAPARVLTETWADQDKAAAMVSAGEISDDEDYLEPSFVRRQQRSRMRREVRAQARRTVARPIQVPTRPRSSKKSSEEIETE
eukprot:780052_1